MEIKPMWGMLFPHLLWHHYALGSEISQYFVKSNNKLLKYKLIVNSLWAPGSWPPSAWSTRGWPPEHILGTHWAHIGHTLDTHWAHVGHMSGIVRQQRLLSSEENCSLASNLTPCFGGMEGPLTSTRLLVLEVSCRVRRIMLKK
jgi:hypothetical protein